MNQQYKIIIVEDDRELLENISTFMNRNGFLATGVSTAAEFFEAVEAEAFDLAVVDIGLPDRNDFQITRYLREGTDTRIIILTARGNIEDKLQGYAAGADAYFVKPVDSWELKGCIDSIMGRRNKPSVNSPSDKESANKDEWLYNPLCITLTAPSGEFINLTTKEDVIVGLLTENSGTNVTRDDIFSELNKTEGVNYDNSALDILFTRLRKRVREKTGEKLPVRTVRSVGYCFFAPVKTIAPAG